MQFVYVINFNEKDKYGRQNKLNDMLSNGWRILSQCAAGDRISYVLEKNDETELKEYDCEDYSIHEM